MHMACFEIVCPHCPMRGHLRRNSQRVGTNKGLGQLPIEERIETAQVTSAKMGETSFGIGLDGNVLA